MTFRDDLLGTVEAARAIVDDLGLRTTRVFVVRREWSASELRTGTDFDVELEIVPRPKVAEAGMGTVTVGPITPSHSIGGYAPSELLPSDEQSVEHLYRLVGPSGESETYRLASVDSRRPFRYMLTLQSLNRVSPSFD
jgi:hypothetical protein